MVLFAHRSQLSEIPCSHVWPFQQWQDSDKASYLLRQHLYSNLHHRLSTRPFLSSIQKVMLDSIYGQMSSMTSDLHHYMLQLGRLCKMHDRAQKCNGACADGLYCSAILKYACCMFCIFTARFESWHALSVLTAPTPFAALATPTCFLLIVLVKCLHVLRNPILHAVLHCIPCYSSQ